MTRVTQPCQGTAPPPRRPRQTATGREAVLWPHHSKHQQPETTEQMFFGGGKDLLSTQFLAQLQMIFVSKLSVNPHTQEEPRYHRAQTTSHKAVEVGSHCWNGAVRGESLLPQPWSLLPPCSLPVATSAQSSHRNNTNICSGALESLLI